MHELYCTYNFLLFTCNFIFHLCNYITNKVVLEEKRWKSRCYLRNKYLRAEKVLFSYCFRFARLRDTFSSQYFSPGKSQLSHMLCSNQCAREKLTGATDTECMFHIKICAFNNYYNLWKNTGVSRLKPSSARNVTFI